ncbi:alpha/beta fold hydrolase [Shouchella sp. 1P09AA]|uniref:alpha/beta hydrolase n=1 Tax=unclassified Shouchella TaxID=2893065 RepID=UPI0039A09543
MIGCLCIHGFTGDPWEVEPIVKELQKQEGWLVYSPVLPGHGKELNQLKTATYEEWVYTVEVAFEELQKRCTEVFVIGFSMGGMLASYIAARYPVAKLVLLNAAAFYFNPKQFFKDMIAAIRFHITGNQEKDQLIELYEKKFKETPFAALAQFLQLVQKTKPYASRISVPTLIIQSEQDGLVPMKSAYHLYDIIESDEKELIAMKRSRHMIFHGFESEEVINQIKAFLIESNEERKKTT